MNYLLASTKAPCPADVLVVLGCRVAQDGSPGPCLEARTRAAVAYYNAGLAPTVLFTGCLGDHPPSEATTAASLAQSLGLPAASVLIEGQSKSTTGNAAGAAKILPPESRVIVVSDAYHLPRAGRVFGCYFDQVQTAPVRSAPWTRIKGALREVAAVSWHGSRGFCDS